MLDFIDPEELAKQEIPKPPKPAKAKTAEELAREHFEESLLEGFGSLMASNEIVSHCELLSTCGDLVDVDENKYDVTGTGNFEKYIMR